MGFVYGAGVGASFLNFNSVNEKSRKKKKKNSQSRRSGTRKSLTARSKVILKSLGYKLKK